MNGGEIFIGFFIGVGFMFFIFVFVEDNRLNISHETGDTICSQITNNSATVASTLNGNLVCKIPTYDHTQNIIIKSNNAEVGEK